VLGCDEDNVKRALPWDTQPGHIQRLGVNIAINLVSEQFPKRPFNV